MPAYVITYKEGSSSAHLTCFQTETELVPKTYHGSVQHRVKYCSKNFANLLEVKLFAMHIIYFSLLFPVP